jgi:hypothetical protein
MERQGWRYDVLWFLACAVLSSVYSVTSASQLGATVDEPDYVFHGMNRWRTGRHNLFMHGGIMPLPCEVQTLPLYLVERVRGQPFEAMPDCTRILPWARAGNLAFWWLVLGYGGYLGRQLGGCWAGRLAMAWLACEPNLLAHASLATTDVSLVACLLALLAHYRAGRVDGQAAWRWRVGAPLVWAGLAFLAKASAVAFVPLVLVAAEIERLVRSDALRADESLGSVWRRLGRFLMVGLIDGGQVLGGGFLLAVLYFGIGSGSAFRSEWAQTHQPHGLLGHAVWQANKYLHSYALGALTFQMHHQEEGHGGALLLGQWYPEGIWYYFPAAFALKLGLPVLAGVCAVGVARPRALANAVMLATALLLVHSLTCRVQIGIRLFLPAVALLVIGVSAALVQCYGLSRFGWQHGLARTAAMCAVGWTLWGSVAVWPHALCYANEAAGGARRNHLNLGDSNHDWGQGLPELLAWQRAHADAPLSVWYFGRNEALQSANLTPIDLQNQPADTLEARLKGRYLAVSTTLLFGGPGKSPTGERLRAMKPAGRTMTFFIYDFTPDAAAP